MKKTAIRDTLFFTKLLKFLGIRYKFHLVMLILTFTMKAISFNTKQTVQLSHMILTKCKRFFLPTKYFAC